MRLIALFISIFLATTAHAGDTSNSMALGFTKDGSHFAFEEFGIHDGLGNTYASIFAIKVADDSWVTGSPIRVKQTEEEMERESKSSDRVADEARRIADIRRRALVKAELVLSNLGPFGFGVRRAHNVPWELTSTPRTMRFTSQNLLPSNGKAWRLELEEIDFPANENCYGFVEQMKGYRLRLTDEVTGVARILNEDTRIPASRPCPLRYVLEEVITHDTPTGRVFAILIRYNTIGFEGPDRRLLAVTGKFF